VGSIKQFTGPQLQKMGKKILEGKHKFWGNIPNEKFFGGGGASFCKMGNTP